MTNTWASVGAVLGLAAVLGALVGACQMDRSDPVQAGDDPDQHETAPQASPGEYEVDSLPPGYQEGPVDTDMGREVLADIYAYLEGLEDRAGEPRITPDRAGFEVPIVGLSEDEAAEVAQLSTGEITVTATVATLSLSELETIAGRLVEHVDGTDTYVRLDTVLEQVTLVSPEPLSDGERTRALSLVDEVLGEVMDTRPPPADAGAPDSTSATALDDIASDDIVIFEDGLHVAPLVG